MRISPFPFLVLLSVGFALSCNLLSPVAAPDLSADGGPSPDLTDATADASLPMTDATLSADGDDSGPVGADGDAGDAGGAYDSGDSAAAADATACSPCAGNLCAPGWCPVAVKTGFGRLNGLYVDPGTTGAVYFGDYDTGYVYAYDKSLGKITTFSEAAPNLIDIVASPTEVFWAAAALAGPTPTGIAWTMRTGAPSGLAVDSDFGDTWSVPYRLGIDGSFLYWRNAGNKDLWRIDLGLTTPTRIYAELLPDGGQSSDSFMGNIAVDQGTGDYVFFATATQLFRMKKDGSGLVAFAPVAPGAAYNNVGVHAGYVYWIDDHQQLVRAAEDPVPTCDAGLCGQVVVPPGAPYLLGPGDFDDTYLYWVGDNFDLSPLVRVRLDGVGGYEILVQHVAIAAVKVDDSAIYYTTQQTLALPENGGLWRMEKH